MSEWMDVDIALASVPVNMLPLIDDTDFKSIEAAVVFNQAGLALFWNFTTTAGVTTVTAVTPTSAGDYDWTDFTTSGMYGIEIPASGGASANNDTEGFGYFTGVATGVLPWRGPTIGFRAAGLNNALIDSAYSTTRGLAGTAVPDAAADAAGGLVISDAGGLDIDTKLANTNEVTAARMAALTDLINDGRLDLIFDAILLDTGTTLDAKLDTIDNFLDTEIAAILVDTSTTLQAELDAIQAAVITNATGADIAADIIALKAETVLIVADTNELQSDDIPTALATVDTVVDAIKAKTDKLTFTSGNNVDSNVQKVNDVTVTGDGASGTEWGP